MNKALPLRDGDDLCQHVRQPDGVNEVKIVQTTQVVIEVKQNTVVMEKCSSCTNFFLK